MGKLRPPAKGFRGGHRFPAFEGEPSGKIERLPLPKRVYVPLRQGIMPWGQTHRREFQPELKPAIAEGERVKAGAIIAQSDEEIATPLHAPISGTVVEITKKPHPWGGEAPAVVIESDGQDDWERLGITKEPEELTAEELQEIFYRAGVTDGGDTGFPTEFKTSPLAPERVERLLIAAVDDEPFVRFNTALLAHGLEHFLKGLELMRRALGGVETHLALSFARDHTERELIKRIVAESPDWLEVHLLPPRYPQGRAEPLIRALFGREVPPGGLPSDVGVVVQDVAHVLAAYEAVYEGKPFIERVIALAGSGLARPMLLRVRMGTPLREVLAEWLLPGSRVLVESALSGFEVQDLEAPVVRNTRAVIALRGPRKRLLAWTDPGFRHASFTRVFLAMPALAKRADFGLHGPERPCIKCGFCLDVCPQELAPNFLGEYAAHEVRDELEELNILACIECGLCSYVCPSKLPLLEQIRAGKRALAGAKV